MRGYPFRSITAGRGPAYPGPQRWTLLPAQDYLRDIVCVGIVFE